jgi:hypothetical protein
MARKEHRYAGWRPRYKGLADDHGYEFEIVRIDLMKHFPNIAKIGGKNEQSQGLRFIVPKSSNQFVKEVELEGTAPPIYLDFLNLECGNGTLRKVERFVNQYGDPLYPDADHPDKPGKNAGTYNAVEVMLEFSRYFRGYVGNVIDAMDSGHKGLLECPKFASYRVHIDLATGEFVADAKRLYDFIFLQIADVFSRGLKITNCEECGAYMTPSRSTRRYCGNTCVKKAERDKAKV